MCKRQLYKDSIAVSLVWPRDGAVAGAPAAGTWPLSECGAGVGQNTAEHI